MNLPGAVISLAVALLSATGLVALWRHPVAPFVPGPFGPTRGAVEAATLARRTLIALTVAVLGVSMFLTGIALVPGSRDISDRAFLGRACVRRGGTWTIIRHGITEAETEYACVLRGP